MCYLDSSIEQSFILAQHKKDDQKLLDENMLCNIRNPKG